MKKNYDYLFLFFCFYFRLWLIIVWYLPQGENDTKQMMLTLEIKWETNAFVYYTFTMGSTAISLLLPMMLKQKKKGRQREIY